MSTQAHGPNEWNRRKNRGRRREDLGFEAPRTLKSRMRYAVFSLAYKHAGIPVLDRRKGPRRRTDQGLPGKES
jgi:hypothetical protein